MRGWRRTRNMRQRSVKIQPETGGKKKTRNKRQRRARSVNYTRLSALGK